MLATATMTMAKNYIEQLLAERGWTVDHLARRADMSYTQTWDIVNNGFRPGTRLGNIEKLANALGVPVSDLLENHKRYN
jgi:DNA-binding Xre family transcriptional regulator